LLLTPSPDPVKEALRRKAAHGLAGTASGRVVARGVGWVAQDVVCNSGPRDRPFEERHDWVAVAVVLSGSFTYGNALGRALLTPGALLLGSAGGCFTCGHEHAAGDRCLSFHFEPSLFEDIAAAAGARTMKFRRNSLPALRSLAPFAARAAAAADGNNSIEELALDLAAAALRENAEHRPPSISRRDERRVTSVVRYLAEHFFEPCGLHELASLVGLSPFHFLRVFRATTGLTPHQHLLRTRLRAAAITLANTATPVTEVALAVGFEDLSNFTRTFRAEYGVTPSRYRLER
jgi:AraC family transcriptional regulator